MKKFISSFIVTMLLMITVCDTASAQYRGRYYGSHRRYHSSTGSALRALDAVETVADYAILGAFLHKLDDYTGIRIGYNAASLRASGFDVNPSTDVMSGVNIGVTFGWYIGKSAVAFEPGLYYSMKGGKLRGIMDKNFTYETEITTHNFEIPFVFKYNIPITDEVFLEPLAGPFLSFGFAGETNWGDGYTDDTYDDNVLEDFDAGIRMGVGLSINRFYLEAAYDLGLLDVSDYANFSRHEDLRTNTWSFSFGVNF